LVSTCHNWSDRRLTMRLYAALDRLVLRSFDRVTTPSPVVAGVLARSGVDPGKVTCIANGVDIETFDHAAPALRRELPNPAGYVVGFAARMVPSKGGDLLLHAASRVLGVCPDVTFVLVGDGPSRTAWTKLAVQLGIAGSVVFAGSRSDMPGVYAAFDQFVLPSLDEAMPMSLLEAMAARKPVIATRVGAVPELVVDGRTGYLLDPGDIQGLAGAISRLKRAPDLARQLGEAGHRLVTASYSSAAMARAYLSVYRSVAPAPLAPTLVPNESN
jgi:glycosyltransferase involved in cell wall biosynthesis